jgi:hypothetical protein
VKTVVAARRGGTAERPPQSVGALPYGVAVPDFHVYEPLEAPDVEVEVDGQWWPGEERMRTTHDDGRLTYHVRWHREGSTYLDKFPVERVRLDTVDRSRGRN